MSVVTSPRQLMTAEEFANWVHRPENANKCFELVRGEVIQLPPAFLGQGVICSNASFLLVSYSRQRRKGFVTGNDAGVVLEKDPDTVRGPDVAYYDECQSLDELVTKYADIPPRLAVEVLSPNDRFSKTIKKINDYLRNGVGLVWFLDPADRTVTVYRAGKEPYVVSNDQELTGDDVLPDFRCRVSDFFLVPGEQTAAGS